MSRKKIIIGTRGSDLARTQTGMMADRIRQVTDIPVETIIIKTQGDRIQDIPLHQIDGKGFFTKELEEALMAEKIDVAVHSLKDLPTQHPPGLIVGAVPERENPADILLVREDKLDEDDQFLLPHGALVGTSSKRRALQLSHIRRDLKFKDIRGNLPTRIGKLQAGSYDAILLARAGYNRLGLKPDGYRIVEMPLDTMLPAPGQGALAIQIRESDAELAGILSSLHDHKTAENAETERHLLHLLGGGCALPLGVTVSRDNGMFRLKAALGPESWLPNEDPVMVTTEVTAETAKEVAELAHRALKSIQNKNSN